MASITIMPFWLLQSVTFDAATELMVGGVNQFTVLVLVACVAEHPPVPVTVSRTNDVPGLAPGVKVAAATDAP